MNSKFPLVSVIVPIYNVEKYLSQCLDSVLQQSYSNLEIILVDDGSPDSSGDICDKYALTDSRIKVIHKQNGGVSSARNTGMYASTGEWLYFIDPDDWIESNALELAINRVLVDKTDMCFFNYTEIYDKGSIPKKSLSTNQSLFMDLKNINVLKTFFSGMGNCWNFIVRSELIVEEIKFSEQLKIYEDVIFKFQIYGKIESFSYIQNNLYNYRKILTSATRIHTANREYPEITILFFNLMKESIKKFSYPINSELIIHSKFIGYFGMVVASFFKNNKFIFAIEGIKNYTRTKEFKEAILNYDKKLIGKTSRIYLMFGKPNLLWNVFVYINWKLFVDKYI